MSWNRSVLSGTTLVLSCGVAAWFAAGLRAAPIASSASGPTDVAHLERRLDETEQALARALDAQGSGPMLASGRAPVSSGASPEHRVAALEKRLQALESRPPEAQSGSAVHDRIRRAQAEIDAAQERIVIRSPDLARTHLQLSEPQVAEFEEIVESVRADWQALQTTANEDGATWRETARVELKSGGITALASAVERVAAFKKSNVPGTGETYGEAQERLHQSLRDRVSRTLSPEQQATWERAQLSGLLRSAISLDKPKNN